MFTIVTLQLEKKSKHFLVMYDNYIGSQIKRFVNSFNNLQGDLIKSISFKIEQKL